MDILCPLVQLYLFALIARIILSWFPITPGGALAGIFSFLYTVTEPVLGPVRNLLPPMGGIDFSPILVFFAISILQRAIGC